MNGYAIAIVAIIGIALVTGAAVLVVAGLMDKHDYYDWSEDDEI